MTRALHTARRRERGFTLIELLVVIAIIAVLLTLSTAAGLHLVARQRISLTQDVLRALDTALENYLSATRGQSPKYDPSLFSRVPGPAIGPSDMTNDYSLGASTAFAAYPQGSATRHARFPDASVFLRQARGVGTVDAVVQQIPARFLVVTVGEGEGQTPGPSDPSADPTPSIIDSWGEIDGWTPPWPITTQRLILYVHPDNKLAQATYGKCVNNRPYFMSAGPDGASGLTFQTRPQTPGEPASGYRARVRETLKDNLYSYPVDPMSSADQTDAFFTTFRDVRPQ